MISTIHNPLRAFLFSFIASVGLFGCSTTPSVNEPTKVALNSRDVRIRKVMDDPSPYEVQIRFTRIKREKDTIYFEDYDYNVDSTRYFYPASTVKFPIAVLALEKINQNRNLDLNTRFYVEGDSLETSFAKEITKIFAVSDNDASNRLLEFLGQNAINESFKEKNIGPARISHRLSVPDADEVTTRPLVIYLNDSSTTLLPNSVNTPPESLNLVGIRKGQGFYEGDSLIQGSFDFSKKNYYPLSTQHGVLKRIIFPEVFPQNEIFDLSDAQRNFLLNAMKTVPREAGYSAEEYYDSYGKFFIYGDSKEEIPSYMKIYNKVGYAYGTLTDCAYVKDEKNDVEFLLTATILVNADGVFNDNVYEYEEIGIPFLTALGSELYQTELKR